MVAKITVEPDGGDWIPAVQDGVSPTLEVDGTYTVNPEELENLADFLDHWEASWAKSLLAYHPEYSYLSYYEDLCNEVPLSGGSYQIDGSYISSETYNNALLQISTYELARSTGNAFGVDLLASAYSGNHFIKSKDPYFHLDYSKIEEVAAAALDVNAFKSALMDEIVSDYKATGLDLWEFCVKSVVCGADFTEACVATSTEAAVEALPTAEQDHIWNTYKQTYLAEKRKVDQIFIDAWAIRGDFYNGYIATEEPTLPNLMGFLYYAADYLLSAPGEVRILSIYTEAIDYAADGEYPWFTEDNVSEFSDKIQRFESVHSEYDAGLPEHEMIDELSEETDAAIYEETGRCGLSYDVEYLLSGMASEGLLPGGSSVNAEDFPGFTPDLYEHMGGGVGASAVIISSSTVGSTIEIKVTNAAGGGILSKTITLNDPPVGTWSDVTSLEMVYYEEGTVMGGVYPFEVLATLDVGGTFYEKVLTGSTTIQIGECYPTASDFQDVICNNEELFANDLKYMFTELYETGKFTTDLASTLAPTVFGGWYSGSKICEQIGDNPYNPESLISTSAVGGYFKLENLDLGANYIIVTFSGGIVPTDIAFVTGAEYDSGIDQLTIHYIDDLGVNNVITASVVSSCSAPPCIPLDLTCMCDKEQALSEGFDLFFNEMLDRATFTGTTDHVDYPYFSELGEILYSDYDSEGITNIGFSKTTSSVSIGYTHSDASVCQLEIVHTGVGTVDMSDLENIFHIKVEEGDVSASFYATGYGYLQTTGTIIPIAIQPASGDETTCFEQVDCGCDLPTVLAPESCTDMFIAYHSVVEALNDAWALDPDYEDDIIPVYSEAEFCAGNLAYSVKAYLNYLDLFGITSPDDDYYISISQFSATDLHHGFGEPDVGGDYHPVETFYLNHASYPDYNWNNYINTVYMAENTICPPAALPYYPDFDFDYPCEMYTANVDTVNAKNQEEIYLEKLAVNFRERYLEEAVSSLVETFEASFVDREYHYTLYYYDQAGNLVQTVPPKGVDRIDLSINEDEVKDARMVNDDITNGEVTGDVLPEHNYRTEYHYNSLNQLVWQHTPDGGESYFGYDALGRLVVSQNAKQRGETNEQFSYTRYDELGRVVEVGEMTLTGDYGFDENGRFIDPTGELVGVSASDFPYGMTDFVSVEEVTKTKYDELLGLSAADFEDYALDNTRNRITGVFYYENFIDGTDDFTTYDNATFYDYDVHGNVKEMIQKINDADLLALSGVDEEHTKKKVAYEYDLVSGNVKHVTYQKGQVDQFIHEYEYDADNRITNVRTSRDNLIWEQDAKYFYYDHGPLARTEIGDKKVHATDYAYTIQGWLKGVNSEDLDADHDQGKDSKGAGINQMVGRDVFGFSLNYYQDDYTARHGNDFLSLSDDPITHDHGKDLYNGNIKEMFTASTGIDEAYIGTSHTWYEYDQLNRIRSMNQEHIESGTTENRYASTYTYDSNGNLKTLTRDAWGDPDGDGTFAKIGIDNFTYHYNDDDPDPQLHNNQLRYVGDALGAGAPVLSDDLADQSVYEGADMGTYGGYSNYAYDEIGQLIQDKQEDIETIEWKVTGKVHKIIRKSGSSKDNLEFVYDAMGNRIMKIITDNGGNLIAKTYYLRDAQGNCMSIYTLADNPSETYKELTLTERSIYGSSRVGTENPGLTLTSYDPGFTEPTELALEQEIGDRRYELSNHLGNVLQVVTDRKLAVDDGTGAVDYYIADVVSQSDYFPFGMVMPNRNEDDGSSYRYSFQGQEKDDEIKGEGNSVNYKYRMHDPRVGRFFAVDPLASKYPYNSPYAFSENRIIDKIELEGLEATSTTTINSDGTTEIKITVKIGVYTNSTTMTQEQLDKVINKATGILESGLVSNDGTVTITTDIQYVQNDPSIPIQIEFVDGHVTHGANTANPTPRPPGVIGTTNEIGNTNDNRVEVLVRGANETEEAFMARTLAHETGHVLGLAHPDIEDARVNGAGNVCFDCPISPIDENDDPDNLMRQTKHKSDPNATSLQPEQAQEVVKVIDKNGGNTTTDNRAKAREHKPLALPKKR